MPRYTMIRYWQMKDRQLKNMTKRHHQQYHGSILKADAESAKPDAKGKQVSVVS